LRCIAEENAEHVEQDYLLRKNMSEWVAIDGPFVLKQALIWEFSFNVVVTVDSLPGTNGD